MLRDVGEGDTDTEGVGPLQVGLQDQVGDVESEHLVSHGSADDESSTNVTTALITSAKQSATHGIGGGSGSR